MHDEFRRRQAYLEAMGITAWFPRVLLPGAPPPLDWGLEEAEELPAPPEQTQAAPSPSAPAVADPGVTAHRERPAASLAAVLDAPARPAPAPAPAVEAPGAGATSSAREESGAEEAPPRFGLVFLPCGKGLAVVALLAEPEEEELGSRRRALLEAVLEARLGLRLADELPQRPFRWPLGPGLDASASAARAALNGFLAHQAEEAGCRVLLVLGERLASLLPPGGAAQRGLPYPLPDQPWRLLLAHSLDDVLAEPARKRALWRDLAPLVGALG